MKIEIELRKDVGCEWSVRVGDRYTGPLDWGEMLSLIAVITMPKDILIERWLQTKEQHDAYKKFCEERRLKREDFDFTLTEVKSDGN